MEPLIQRPTEGCSSGHGADAHVRADRRALRVHDRTAANATVPQQADARRQSEQQPPPQPGHSHLSPVPRRPEHQRHHHTASVVDAVRERHRLLEVGSVGWKCKEFFSAVASAPSLVAASKVIFFR